MKPNRSAFLLATCRAGPWRSSPKGEADPITILFSDADQRRATERVAGGAEAEKTEPSESARTGGKLRRLLGLGRDQA